MNKQTIINRLEALDLSQYPYFEKKKKKKKKKTNRQNNH